MLAGAAAAAQVAAELAGHTGAAAADSGRSASSARPPKVSVVEGTAKGVGGVPGQLTKLAHGPKSGSPKTGGGPLGNAGAFDDAPSFASRAPWDVADIAINWVGAAADAGRPTEVEASASDHDPSTEDTVTKESNHADGKPVAVSVPGADAAVASPAMAA